MIADSTAGIFAKSAGKVFSAKHNTARGNNGKGAFARSLEKAHNKVDQKETSATSTSSSEDKNETEAARLQRQGHKKAGTKKTEKCGTGEKAKPTSGEDKDNGEASDSNGIAAIAAAVTSVNQSTQTNSAESGSTLPTAAQGNGAQLPGASQESPTGEQLSTVANAKEIATETQLQATVSDPTKAKPGTQAENSNEVAGQTDNNGQNSGVDTNLKVSGEQDSNSTDIKKIIDHESHRLQSSKIISSAGENNQETNSDAQLTKLANENTQTGQVLNQTDFQPLKDLNEVNTGKTSSSGQSPETNDIIDQIVKKAELMVKQNASEMKIQLKPEFLGKMLVKVMVEDGVVTTRFVTENQHVKQVLESNLNTLRQSLESNGIKVEKAEVSVQLYNDGNFNNSGGGHNMWQQPKDSNSNYNQQSWSYQDDLADMEGIIDNEYSQNQTGYGISNDGGVNFVI